MIRYKHEYINDELLPVVLNIQGALLIRGFNAMRTAEDFQHVISSIFPKLMDYVGGTSPREQVYGNIMTATNMPPSWSIPLHQEMSYLKNSPSRIAFFCTQPAISGGYSTLGNMRYVTDIIAPDVMKKFKTHGLQLCRSLPSLKTINDKPGVQKAWSEVFSTTNRDQVDEISKHKGWCTEWLNNDTLRIWQEILPATKLHPYDQTEVWFNQVHMFSPVCSELWAKRDAREDDYLRLCDARNNNPDMLDKVFYGNGELVSKEDATYISRILEESEIQTKLTNSDLLILDNIFVAHGRSPFSGKREILVALIESRN